MLFGEGLSRLPPLMSFGSRASKRDPVGDRESKRKSTHTGEDPEDDRRRSFVTKAIDGIVEGIPGYTGSGERISREGHGFEGMHTLKATQPHACYLIEPDSERLALWDCFTSLTLLFIAIFTPYEVAFLPAPTRGDSPLFILGRLIDAIFAIDMIVQILTMVPSAEEPDKLETRWPVILRTYMEGWFLLDFVSLASSTFDIIPLINGSAEGKKSPVTTFRIVRVLVRACAPCCAAPSARRSPNCGARAC